MAKKTKSPAKPKHKPTGRPSTFSPAIADAICLRLADGESLRTICTAKDMPAKSTVFLWLIKHSVFSDQYAQAREAQAASYADDIVDIADTEKDPQKARVRIDARKWHASKLAPKKYGDKVALVGGGAGDSPIQTVDLTKATDEHLAKLETIIGEVANARANQG